MSTSKSQKKRKLQEHMPSLERIQQELGTAESMDDFFGKEGIFARLFGDTLEVMLEAELTEHLGYEPYEAQGRNSGNSRNGSYAKKVRTSAGDLELEVPRDREGSFTPQVVKKYQTSSNELEDKIVMMYARGMTQRDIEMQLAEMYGVEVSAQTVSTIVNKIMPLVEAWHTRPLAAVYPIISQYLRSGQVIWMPFTTSCAKTIKSRTAPFISFWQSVWMATRRF